MKIIQLFFISLYLLFIEINAEVLRVPLDYSSIQEAIDSSSNGDTILIGSGIYSGLFVIEKSISIIGENSNVEIYGFDPTTTFEPTIQIKNTSNVFLSSITIIGRSYGIWYPGCAALSITNSTNVSLINVYLKGGIGADWGVGGGWSWGPKNGGNGCVLSNSRKVYANNCSFRKGAPGENSPPWSPYHFPDADSGISIVATNSSEIRVFNSYLDLPISHDESSIIVIYNTTSVQGRKTPLLFSLSQNYPNPFNPKTKIQFTTAKRSDIKLIVFDILGNKVATLIDDTRSRGEYEIEFDGSNLSSGVYFYKLMSDDNAITKKFIILK